MLMNNFLMSNIPDLFVAFKNLAMLVPNGNTDVVAPISAPMLQIVPIPVGKINFVLQGIQFSIIALLY